MRQGVLETADLQHPAVNESIPAEKATGLGALKRIARRDKFTTAITEFV